MGRPKRVADPGAGAMLREARERAGLRQVEASKILGLSRGYLSLLENGHLESVSRETLVEMARLYGVNADRLLVAYGWLPEDIEEMLSGNVAMWRFLRAVKAHSLTAEDLFRLLPVERAGYASGALPDDELIEARERGEVQ